MTGSPSTIQFLDDWREEHGAIESGSRLTLEYDKTRLPVNHQVFTDGILHQFELTEDALVRS